MDKQEITSGWILALREIRTAQCAVLLKIPAIGRREVGR